MDFGLEEEGSADPFFSLEERQYKTEQALKRLDALAQKPVWWDEYNTLRAAGWNWQQAALIAWEGMPKNLRVPATQNAFATEILGLNSFKPCRKWKAKNPVLVEWIGLSQSQQLFDARAEIIGALVESAVTPDHKNHPDRKLALEMTGDYTPRKQVDVSTDAKTGLEGMSSEELAALAERD